MRIFENIALGTKVTCKVAKRLANGTLGTIQTTGEIINDVSNGNPQSASRKIGNFLGNKIVAGAEAISSVDKLSNQNDTDKKEKVELIANTAIAGILLISATEIDANSDTDNHFESGSDEITSDDSNIELSLESCPVHGSDCDSIFVDSEDNLSQLIEAGEVNNEVHLRSDEIERDNSIRDSFLRAHGFESTPDGYEVHHIVPLSEGGVDSPDNMILVSEDTHDKITAEHRKFFKWNS